MLWGERRKIEFDTDVFGGSSGILIMRSSVHREGGMNRSELLTNIFFSCFAIKGKKLYEKSIRDL